MPRRIDPPAETGASVAPGSRRDAILVAAAKLFRDNGYSPVTMDDIGREVGVTGPALYRHFSSKEEILVSVLTYAGDRIDAAARDVRRTSSTPRRALRAIVQSYLGEVIPHRRLVGSYLQGTGISHESEAAAPLRVRQQKYLKQIATLLRQARPELTPTQALTLVHATFGVLNSVAWLDLTIDKNTADLLESAAMATLYSGTARTDSRRTNVAPTRIRATA